MKHLALALVLLALLAAYASCARAAGIDGASASSASWARRPVIIDTDANTDDAMALLWLLKRPDLDIKAITVTGTGWCSLSSGLTNVFNLLAFMRREDIPVTWGSPYPLYEVSTGNYDCIYSKTIPNAPGGRQWADTLVGLAHCFPKSGPSRYYNPNAPDAVELIASVLNASSVPIDILELGPATTIASLISKHPSLVPKIGRFVFSGGAVYVGGNIFYNVPNGYAEYNALGDPDALAQVVLSGVDVVLVPLDATGQLIVDQSFLDTLQASQRTSECHWVYSLLATLQTQMGPFFNTYSLWDPYAAAVLADQQRYAANVTRVPITVVTQTLDASQVGRTKPDPQGTLVSAVLVPNPVIFSDLLVYLNSPFGRSPSSFCFQTSQGVWY